MKKYMYTFLAFLLVISFLGCSETNTTTEEETLVSLDTPTNINIEGVMVSWDEVDGASSYDIYLNEDIFNVTSNYYLIEEEGSYDIKVIAKGEGYLDSLPSEILTATIAYEDNVNYNIVISEELISWDEIVDASEYNIYINGEVFRTSNTEFSFADINGGLLVINIQAVYPLGQANISDNEIVEHNIETTRNRYYQYSTNSTQNILIMDLAIEEEVSITNASGDLLDNNDILAKNNFYEIKSDYILNQEDDNIHLYLYYGNKKSEVIINVSEKVAPYIISSTLVYTNGEEDIKLQFELFTGDFRQISGEDLESEDYSIEDNILTIYASYIDSRFQTETDFTINYALETDEIAFGLIIFNKEIE
ncbi:MAG: hypothetical protein R6U15_08095 [Candidatus Izemoplasmatales bacterium]